MYSKRSVEEDGPDSRPVRTSDRLKSRTKFHNRSTYNIYYPPNLIRSNRKKTKTRTAAAEIAKRMLHKKRTSKSNVWLMILMDFCSYIF